MDNKSGNISYITKLKALTGVFLLATAMMFGSTENSRANDCLLISSQDTIIFDFSNAVCASGYMEVPVRFNSDEQVYAMDFALKFDPSVFTYISVTSLKGYLAVSANYNGSDSTLRFSSSSLQVIDNNTNLIMVRFSLPVSQIDYQDFVSVYTLLNGDDCSAKAIEPVPAAIIVPGGDTAILPGDSLSLSYVPHPPLTYLWSTNESDSIIYVTFPGTYSLTTYYGNGCQTVNSILITQADPLPVSYLFFNAEQIDENIDISWATAAELNCDFFVIERSQDFTEWNSLDSVAGSGTSNADNHYRYTDYNPAQGWNYYRLKQVDFDGSHSYSDVEAGYFAGLKSAEILTVFPNPVRGNEIQFNWNQRWPQILNAQLIGFDGSVIDTQMAEYQSGKGSLVFDGLSIPGLYILKVKTLDKELSTLVMCLK